MSDAGKEQRERRFYLDDMLKFARKVQTYTDGLTQADFGVKGLTYDATLRNLELIGEAGGALDSAGTAALGISGCRSSNI